AARSCPSPATSPRSSACRPSAWSATTTACAIADSASRSRSRRTAITSSRPPCACTSTPMPASPSSTARAVSHAIAPTAPASARTADRPLKPARRPPGGLVDNAPRSPQPPPGQQQQRTFNVLRKPDIFTCYRQLFHRSALEKQNGDCDRCQRRNCGHPGEHQGRRQSSGAAGAQRHAPGAPVGEEDENQKRQNHEGDRVVCRSREARTEGEQKGAAAEDGGGLERKSRSAEVPEEEAARSRCERQRRHPEARQARMEQNEAEARGRDRRHDRCIEAPGAFEAAQGGRGGDPEAEQQGDQD